MKLEYMLLKTLRDGAGKLSHEDRELMTEYVRNQMADDGSFINRAGKKDLYYTMFGWMVCYAMDIESNKDKRTHYLKNIDERNLDDLHRSVYRQCQLINSLLNKGLVMTGLRYLFHKDNIKDFFRQYVKHTKGTALNSEAVRVLIEPTPTLPKGGGSKETEIGTASPPFGRVGVGYILSLQDETGGFRANEGAAIPDILSTAVALFTLKMKGVCPRYDARDFIEVHINEDGAFMSTLLDETGDIEYMFYGLLALGAETN